MEGTVANPTPDSALFEELLTRLPDLHISGEPAYLQSNFINGIKRMPATFTPVAPVGAR